MPKRTRLDRVGRYQATIYLPRDLEEKLKEEARARECSAASIIRYALRTLLDPGVAGAAQQG
jgi:hypothetical protein